MTLADLEALISFCLPVGMVFGATPVLVVVFLGVAVRTFEDTVYYS